MALASNSGVLSTIQHAAQHVLHNGWSLLLPTAEERAHALSALLPVPGKRRVKEIDILDFAALKSMLLKIIFIILSL